MEKILVVDDSVVYRKLLTQTVTEFGYEAMQAEDGKSAIAILQTQDSPDLVLLDRLMPGMNGDEVCRWVRANLSEETNPCYKYIILLTSKDSHTDMLDGFELGADDYLFKPFDPSELKARLSVGARILSLQRQLQFAATRDFMTGLYNRRAFMENAPLEISRARRNGKQIAMVIADIDNFKSVNDTYGHMVGDEVIRQVGSLLKSALRDFDLVGRIGGEEFAAAFVVDNREQMAQICERIRKSVEEKQIQAMEAVVRVTISVGAALLANDMALEVCLQQADQAMYQAKGAGKNRVAMFGT